MNVFILKADCVKTNFVCARKFVKALIVQKKKIHSCPIGIKKVKLMFNFYSFKSSQL